jgi:hypothetical protein
MANRDLLKEAIADAKAVKETAIANAKAALEEAFAPRMQELLKAKLEEMDKEELEEADEKMEEGLEEMYDTTEEAMDMDNMEEAENVDEVDLEELLRELDELEEGEDSVEERLGTINDPIGDSEHGNLAEAEEGEEESEEGEEEEIDLENMSEDDLKSFIESVIADMVSSGELEGNMEAGEEEGEEEIEITERKKVKSTKLVKEMNTGKPDQQSTMTFAEMLGVDPDDPMFQSAFEEGDIYEIINMLVVTAGNGDEENPFDGVYTKGDFKAAAEEAQFSDEMIDELLDMEEIQNLEIGFMPNESKNSKMMKEVYKAKKEKVEAKKELKEALNTISTIKAELNEVNLLNAKLLYTNKIFKAKNLTESQKVKVLEAFDKAASVKEAKLVFETLSGNFASTAKKPMNESLIRGGASKPAGVSEKKPIMEANAQVARWQKLAGIK